MLKKDFDKFEEDSFSSKPNQNGIIFPNIEPEKIYFCDCNLEAKIANSNSSDNPGRKYAGCPNYPKKKSCTFFRWLEPPIGICFFNKK